MKELRVTIDGISHYVFILHQEGNKLTVASDYERPKSTRMIRKDPITGDEYFLYHGSRLYLSDFRTFQQPKNRKLWPINP